MDDTIQDSVDELRVRSYQAEMLKRSLEGNVIVVVLLLLVGTQNSCLLNTDGYWQWKNSYVSQFAGSEKLADFRHTELYFVSERS